ncbi:AraC family transcriptional regulator [Corynebacterium aurimucosum]|nr:AraC family transcriptional regulator [Corynebacterium aurimucosum]QQU92016.1 helix-turn-helix domain-containing protein [Corynebacterium aurimucosum]
MSEFYAEHTPPARSAAWRQYVYDIGSYHYNWHSPIELLTILGGSVEINRASGTRVLSRGDVVLFNSNEGHATMSLEPREGTASAQALLIHLDTSYVASFNRGFIPQFSCCSTDFSGTHLGISELRKLSSQMMLEAQKVDSLSKEVAQESRLAAICAVLYRDFFEGDAPAARSADAERLQEMRRVIEYVDEHYQQKITLRNLADFAGYSPAYFSDLFSSVVGIPVSEYITRVRLAEAVQLLRRTDWPITDVALAAGFPDNKALSLAFRRAFSKTASQYRKQLRSVEKTGVNVAAVDERFHEYFVSTTDSFVRDTLSEFAGESAEGRVAAEREQLQSLLAEVSQQAEKSGRHGAERDDAVDPVKAVILSERYWN